MPIIKIVVATLAFFVFVHWMTAGTDEVIQGPPKEPNPDFCVSNCPVE